MSKKWLSIKNIIMIVALFLIGCADQEKIKTLEAIRAAKNECEILCWPKKPSFKDNICSCIKENK